MCFLWQCIVESCLLVHQWFLLSGQVLTTIIQVRSFSTWLGCLSTLGCSFQHVESTFSFGFGSLSPPLSRMMLNETQEIKRSSQYRYMVFYPNIFIHCSKYILCQQTAFFGAWDRPHFSVHVFFVNLSIRGDVFFDSVWWYLLNHEIYTVRNYMC